jgi:hypothetical protein
MDVPKISETIIFADDAKLAARLSCAFAKRGIYLPVCDGPRIQRPDREAEVIRRHNVAARAKAKRAYLARLNDEADGMLRRSLTRIRGMQCRTGTDADADSAFPPETIPLAWGKDRIGVGMLQAMREKRGIIFESKESPLHSVPSKSGHLVVCEVGEELSQVIAANYAYALDAGLHLIPAVSREQSEDVLGAFYKLYDRDSDVPPAEAQQRLRDQLFAMCGALPVPKGGSITFVGSLPYGFAYSDHPSTHLFDYPDLGCAVINGFAAEQAAGAGTGVVTLVDPGQTPAPEIKAAVRLLKPRRAFVRVYQGPSANVRHVSEMLEHFPYDLLIIATHCGDSGGYRWTYKFTDSENIPRELVVDIAIGVARTDDPNMLKVGHFMRFVSLDGVDWTDPIAKERLYVGQAIRDFIKLTAQGPNELKPVKKDKIDRVIGSSAMKMSDHNLLFAYPTMADTGTPIVINNACLSWHRLAGDMTFAGARAYIGTLFPVTTSEAEAVVLKIIDKHWGKLLPVAVWAAQRDVYRDIPRRPYVVSGIFPQRLRIKTLDYPRRIYQRLTRSLGAWTARLNELGANADPTQRKATEEIVKIYRREVEHFAEILRG